MSSVAGEVESWSHKRSCDRAEAMALEFVRIAEEAITERYGSYLRTSMAGDAIGLASIMANLYIGLELKEVLDIQRPSP